MSRLDPNRLVEARVRMDRPGYMRGLEIEVARLGSTVKRVIQVNLLNPTTGYVVRPHVRDLPDGRDCWIVPGSNSTLVPRAGAWRSPETGRVSPELEGLPILRQDLATLASRLGGDAT